MSTRALIWAKMGSNCKPLASQVSSRLICLAWEALHRLSIKQEDNSSSHTLLCSTLQYLATVLSALPHYSSTRRTGIKSRRRIMIDKQEGHSLLSCYRRLRQRLAIVVELLDSRQIWAQLWLCCHRRQGRVHSDNRVRTIRAWTLRLQLPVLRLWSMSLDSK